MPPHRSIRYFDSLLTPTVEQRARRSQPHNHIPSFSVATPPGVARALGLSSARRLQPFVSQRPISRTVTQRPPMACCRLVTERPRRRFPFWAGEPTAWRCHVTQAANESSPSHDFHNPHPLFPL